MRPTVAPSRASPGASDCRAAGIPPRRRTSARALSSHEREAVREVLQDPRLVDRSPVEILATPLDEGQHLCSERTIDIPHPGPGRERAGSGATHCTIRAMRGPSSWPLLQTRSHASLASRLVEGICEKHAARPEVLTLHSDRGTPMTARHTAQPAADPGVTQSIHGRISRNAAEVREAVATFADDYNGAGGRRSSPSRQTSNRGAIPCYAFRRSVNPCPGNRGRYIRS